MLYSYAEEQPWSLIGIRSYYPTPKVFKKSIDTNKLIYYDVERKRG